MTKTITAALLLTSLSAQADVFCKTSGQIINVLHINGYFCNAEFFTAGNVCFTGPRAKAIELLNSEDFQNNFAGTDGEYVSNAYFQGRDSISYDFVDEANEYQEKMTLNRCTKDFFKL